MLMKNPWNPFHPSYGIALSQLFFILLRPHCKMQCLQLILHRTLVDSDLNLMLNSL